jgi:hypothetical protein
MAGTVTRAVTRRDPGGRDPATWSVRRSARRREPNLNIMLPMFQSRPGPGPGPDASAVSPRPLIKLMVRPGIR